MLEARKLSRQYNCMFFALFPMISIGLKAQFSLHNFKFFDFEYFTWLRNYYLRSQGRDNILFAEIEKKVHLAAQDDWKHMTDCHLVLPGVTSENQEKNNWIDL